MKIKVTLFIVVIILTCGWFCHMISSDVEDNIRALKDDPGVSTKKIPKDYLKILNSNKISLLESYKGKYRCAISDFKYARGYFVELCKIDSLSNLPLTTLIDENYQSTYETDHTVYTGGYEPKPFDIRYKAGKPDKPTSVHFTLSGEGTNIVAKNDTVACYFSNFSDFSITYGDNVTKDIFGQPTESDSSLPLEILFLKQNKNLYLIIMSGSKGYSLKRGMLYNLIVKSK